MGAYCLLSFGAELETWAEFAFLTWGDHVLDIQGQMLDGEAEFLVLPRPETLNRLHFLRLREVQPVQEKGKQPAIEFNLRTKKHDMQLFEHADGMNFLVITPSLVCLYNLRDVHYHLEDWARRSNVG